MAFTKYTKAIKYNHVGAMLVTALLVFVLVPGITFREDINNLITVFVNGTSVGETNDVSVVEGMILEARKRIAREYEGLVLINYEVVLSGTRAVFGTLDDEETIINNIYQVFSESIQKTRSASSPST